MIVDANVFSMLFCIKNERHEKYAKLLEWILYGRAKMVYGGYLRKEYHQMHKFINLLLELKKINKFHSLSDAENTRIEEETERIRQEIKDADFDDPHIIALVIISKARIVCSEDQRFFKFLKRKEVYPKHVAVPKIYTALSAHEPQDSLLCDENLCSNGEHKALPNEKIKKIFAIL